MEKKLHKLYEEERNNFLNNCIECGICIEKCPIIEKTYLKDKDSKEIIREMKAFLNDQIERETVYTRAYSCMECFKCMQNTCPKNISPMTLNELIRWQYKEKKNHDVTRNQKENDADQKILASIQVSKEVFQKITTCSQKATAKYVFFPGCNVYAQPEKILNALDIMNMITSDYAFVKGLDYCCGDIDIYDGFIPEAEVKFDKLIQQVSSYHPETLILWCPTCHCRFQKTISKIRELPFDIISFPQFVSRNQDSLTFKKALNKKVTLHEPCKSAYTGVDLDGVRNLMNYIPGIELIEMKRNRENTVCCGSGAITYFPESFNKIRDERLEETSQTDVDILIDVCHYCHEAFVSEEKKYHYAMVNYINLLAESLGVEREDKFKKYKQWGDLDKIMEDADTFIKQSSYSKEQILKALKKYFDLSC